LALDVFAADVDAFRWRIGEQKGASGNQSIPWITASLLDDAWLLATGSKIEMKLTS
jgi:hypothetical protein